MRVIPLLSLLLISASISSQAQVRSGGIFGFGRSGEQISSDLFPDASAPTSAQPAIATQEPAAPVRDSDNIFRGGEPGDVEAVSYVIQGGEKVKQKTPKERKGFFGFGSKKEESTPPAAVESETSSMATYPDSTSEPSSIPAGPAATVAAPPAPSVVDSDDNEAMLRAVVATEEKKEKSGGPFSFFRRGKKEKEGETLAATPIAAPVPDDANASSSSIQPIPEPSPMTSAPATSSDSAPTSTAPAEGGGVPDVPQFAGNEQPKKEKEGFRLNPIKKI
ncbi:MAG: hypothetical protein AAGC68_10140, partial [Verrucomicrobiota bacterium]